MNTKTVMLMLGISEKHLANLRNAGLPFSKSGRNNIYDPLEVVPWYLKYKESLDNRDVNEERAKLLHFQAKEKEIHVKKLEGELIPADEIEEGWVRLVTNCKHKLLALPSKCAPLILGEDNVKSINKILKNQVYEALTELSNGDMNKEVV